MSNINEKQTITIYKEINIGTYYLNTLSNMIKNIITKINELKKIYKDEFIELIIYKATINIILNRLETDEEYSLRIKQIPIKDKITKLNDKGVYSLRELTSSELDYLLKKRKSNDQNKS